MRISDWSSDVCSSDLTIAVGAVLAVGLSAIIVALSPLAQATTEIMARTRPTLLDLLVAVFSAAAGGYATVRRKSDTLVGVAIATALMPPLAVVGFGLSTRDWPIFLGASWLFMTNQTGRESCRERVCTYG